MAKPNHLQILRMHFGRNSRAGRHPASLLSHRSEITTSSPAGVDRVSSSSTSSTSSYSSSSSDDIANLRERILVLSEKSKILPRDGEFDDARSQIFSLADELLASNQFKNLEDEDDLTCLADFFESRSAVSLLRRFPSGLAFVELLFRLKSRPRLAVQVFLWRLKLADDGVQLVPEEYAKAISLAGRSKKADLACDLFTDAGRRGIRSTGMYNSLMSAYMYNGLTSKAVSVFEDLGRDPVCKANIVTHNILLSVYGRLLLIDKVESIFKQILDHPRLAPNLNTYNILIAAYLTAWMWDRMEATFDAMVNGNVKPDAFTHCLMLRGYAHACNIEKMEKMYELVKDLVKQSVPSPLIRAMICAYCKSSDTDRVKKIEELTKHIPEDEYRPWLNALMIRLYAQEGLLDSMERLISEAIHRDVKIIAIGVIRSIISCYFRCNSVDHLTRFIGMAECAGWKRCRSLYHCKMVMYGQQNQMEKMHGVLEEMKIFRFDRTKKTFLIMYKAYTKAGRRSEAEILIGMMCKYGFLEPNAALLW